MNFGIKRLILVLILSVSSLLATSQDTLKVPIPDSTALTAGKVYNDVKAGLSGLSQSLKVGAEYVFTIMVKQQVVEAISCLILLVLALFLIVNWFYAYKSTERWYNSDDPTLIGVVRVFQLFFGTVMVLISLFNIDTIVMGFINPEYGAVKDIIEFVK